MSNFRFNQRQLRFLELFFSGYKMKTAARAAGYKGRSDQALCNTGRKILNKLSKNQKSFFRLAGTRERMIVQLLDDMAFNSESTSQRLKALKILARCYYP